MKTLNACGQIGLSPMLRINDMVLSEDDILALNDKFLTPGFHEIEISNFRTGRELVWRFLAHMKYGNVACVSVDKHAFCVPEFVVDVYQELLRDNRIYNEACIDDYFLNEFAFDFLWIELSSELANSLWLARFKAKLCEHDLVGQLPILIVHPYQIAEYCN